MKLIIVACVLAVCATIATAQTCKAGTWGTDCLNACGKCNTDDGINCNGTGSCPNGCIAGYEGDRCDIPICNHVTSCSPGICVAPDVCGACGDINYVGPKCEDIRLKGLLGSLIALAVISVSITLCGIGSVYYKRSRNTPVAL